MSPNGPAYGRFSWDIIVKPSGGLALSAEALRGSVVLVTGGTGSFGRRFVKFALDCGVRRIVVFSRDELKQFELAQKIDDPRVRWFLGDVRDEERVARALHGVDYVVHAAALKQVPAAEYNPMECIKTNVLGAENLINASIDAKVKRVIALSTDKAVNPINLYGATKLCADKLFVAANHLSGGAGTRFATVRYGNVVGSRGSVIPFFMAHRKHGWLPITDERMTRFWITLTEGVQFVSSCLDVMDGGEIFVPKIATMRIVDLAKAMAPEAELRNVGIRPGEKLHEILVPKDEARNTRDHGGLYVIRPSMHRWTKDENITIRGVPGTPVDEEFEYASDSAGQRLDAAALHAMIDQTAQDYD
jgi:UDP-N-acetylglucosamine 4,6-dehydratase